MKLIPEQKRFVREHFQDMSVKEMAGHLGVEPKDVRWAMAELGLVPQEVREREEREGLQRSRAWRRERWRQRLGSLKRAGPGFLLMGGLALVVRSIQLILVADDPALAEPTGIADVYHQWGILVAQGDWLSRWEPVFYHPPVYAYFLGLVYAVAGPSPFLVGLLQVLLSAVTAGLVLLLGRRIFGPVCGLLAGAMAVVYGMFIHQVGMLVPETLVVFLTTAVLVALVGAMQRPKWWRWLWSGLLLGLLVAARGPLWLFVPLALVAVLTWFRPGEAKRWVPAWLLFLAGFALGLSPLPLHNRLVGGEWVTLTASFGPDLYTGNHRGSDGMADRPPVYRGRELGRSPSEIRTSYARIAGRSAGPKGAAPGAISKFWVKASLDDMGADKGSYFELLWRKIRIYFNAHEGPAARPWASQGDGPGIGKLGLPFGAIAPLALLGLVISIRGFRKRGVLVWFVLAHLIGLLVFWVDARYRLPLVPVMLVYAAAMLRWLWQKASKRRWVPLGISLVMAAGAYVACWMPLPEAPAQAAAKPAAVRPAKPVAPPAPSPGPAAPEQHGAAESPKPLPAGLDPPNGEPGSIRLAPPESSIPK